MKQYTLSQPMVQTTTSGSNHNQWVKQEIKKEIKNYLQAKADVM